MKDNRWLALISLSMLWTGFLLAEGAVSPREGVVKSNSLILRSKPATFYERLGVLNQGETVRIVRQQDDWYEILLPRNVFGWVRNDQLDADNTVISDTCFLYAGAGERFTVFHHIPPSTKLTLVGIPNDGWCQVVPPAEATAWVSAAYVALPSPEDQTNQPDSAAPPAIDAPLPDTSALEEQRNRLKAEHARQQSRLEEEQQRLTALRSEAEKLKQATQQDATALDDLQREIERLQLLRENAEIKAALARSEREKALLLAAEEQQKLEEQKLAAEAKAKTVLSEKDKWEAEATKVAAALAESRAESHRQAETARAEAAQLELEKLAIVEKAEAALKRAQEAEDRRRESEEKQTLTEQAILALQTDLQQAEQKVENLRQERERMEAATREEASKLEQVRLEAERLSRENAEIQQRLEDARQERQSLARQKLEDEKRQQELKAQEKVQVVTASAAVQVVLPPTAESEVVKPELPDGRQRILLTPPEATTATPEGAVEASAEAKQPAVAKAEQSAAATAEAQQPPAPAETEPPAAETEQPADSPRKKMAGVVISLQDKASTYASHVLCENRNFTLVPICYLHSSILDLRSWEHLSVEITGEEVSIAGWSRPVLKVDGIIRK